MAKVILVTGGCRSGKSQFAEHLALSASEIRRYIATCPVCDGEMAERVRRHRERRSADGWVTIEEPLHLTEALKQCPPGSAVLVDCLTLWISNWMFEAEKQGKCLDEAATEQECLRLQQTLKAMPATVVFVQNEVGMGVVPENALARRFRDCSGRCGQIVAGFADEVYLLAATLGQVPAHGARTFHEALQALRILHYCLWCEGEYHCGLGRIDQYLLPYLEGDLAAGRLTEETALEELEEFFIACNRDSDLYIGVQQGDNGQSVMLGGCTRDGKPAFNRLSRLAMKACGELKLVDPKINLRVDKNTPKEIYELGTELTKAGLGFPQYANDDVVIPALVKWGYELEDARDYSVAACWEFLVPGCGMDINNIDAVSMPKCLDTAMRKGAGTFEALQANMRAEIFHQCDLLQEKYRHVEIFPGPFVSVISTGCIEKARDISRGAKYNNFGIHGTGIAVAVDALASVRELVFEKKLVTMAELVNLMDTDFAGRPEILAAARTAPKMGNADASVDELAKWLVETWADALAGRKNDRGGIYRPGTGSAMYYIWHANELPASADGRLKGHPFSANYAPSLDVPVKGPLSVIRSFTTPDLGRVCNGGPLTIEVHDSAFREPDGVEKVAQLVKFFVDRGGHQLQINAINRETLVDAQKHPDLHRHLIVRVWGWSGYFIELDKPYQDQVIKRVELAV